MKEITAKEARENLYIEELRDLAYGCVKTWAGLLGETQAQSLLEQTLNAEKKPDEKLTELSADVNLNAIGNEGQAAKIQIAWRRRKLSTWQGEDTDRLLLAFLFHLSRTTKISKPGGFGMERELARN